PEPRRRSQRRFTCPHGWRRRGPERAQVPSHLNPGAVANDDLPALMGGGGAALSVHSTSVPDSKKSRKLYSGVRISLMVSGSERDNSGIIRRKVLHSC